MKRRWPVVLLVVVSFIALAYGKNYSDMLGLPMSYLYNDAQFLNAGNAFTVLTTTNVDGYVFISGASGTGAWTNIVPILTVGFAINATFLNGFLVTNTTDAAGKVNRSFTSNAIGIGTNPPPGVTTNLVIGGSTLFITNGIVKGLQ